MAPTDDPEVIDPWAAWPRGVFTLPPTMPMLETIAHGIWQRCQAEPMSLAQITIMLPTRRACRAMRAAFLELAADGDEGEEAALLLPILRPIGDVDEDELVLTGDDPGLEPLPPAIGALNRQMRLARAILAKPSDEPIAPELAADLAAELARLLDQLDTEGIELDAFHGLVPDDYAEHWQETLTFLDILGQHWPGILEQLGAINPAHYRDLWLRRAAARLVREAPKEPVLIVGSTGSIPATMALMHAVCALDHGAVILPGLDQSLSPADMPDLPESHPQHQLLRAALSLKPEARDLVEDVPLWPKPHPEAAMPPLVVRQRDGLIRALTQGMLDEAEPAAVEGITPVDCTGPEHEATVAALAMREVLDNDALVGPQTVMLVTPDRDLARRVASILGRFGITVNDSGGQPLGETPVGNWLRMTATLMAGDLRPRDLLATFKHPFAALGRSTAQCRESIRLLERLALRGPTPGAGVEGLHGAIEAAASDPRRQATPGMIKLCQGFVNDLADALPVFEDARSPLASLVQAHIKLAEALAATPDTEGSERLWCDEAGEQAAAFLTDLMGASDGFPPLAPSAYAAFLATLMEGQVVRPRQQAHPRLTILGLLEARLVRADRVILAGLNEGTWPPEPTADPWLSRPMRRQLGLPTPERRLGQQAHDFAQALGADEVFLLRAIRQGGAPTIPARWLQYLDVLMTRWSGLEGAEAKPLETMKDRAKRYHDWALALDRPDPDQVQPIAPPEPRPAAAQRPTDLRVTDVSLLMRNPYGFYARNILGLNALDDLELPPGASDRGKLIHDALNLYIKQHGKAIEADALDRLLEIGEGLFAPLAGQPEIHSFWWSRFERIAAWFVDYEQERRAQGWAPLATELAGKVTIKGERSETSLRGRADRFDAHADALSVIDYKTGGVPDRNQVYLGIEPQLALEAVMARDGGFEGVAAAAQSRLEYWQLNGLGAGGKLNDYDGDDAQALVDYAAAGIVALMDAFADPARPYLAVPRPKLAPRFDDYRHLSRVDEWAPGLLEDR
ncbi:MAG: double-strand break repair protein AddB [Alphaproteobacteria bacterium]|nr:double-strand break repair protein AddB [Alphaproteobacteria bacterium SS10]